MNVTLYGSMNLHPSLCGKNICWGWLWTWRW